MVPTLQTLTASLDALDLGGETLREVVLSGVRYGAPDGDPVVLIGGITATPYALGGGSEAAWWSAVGGRFDLTRTCLLCPALPGHGTTWAGLSGDGPLPRLSANDLAVLVSRWLDAVGCQRPVTFVGASLGGMIGLALAAAEPARVGRLVSISAGLRPDGWGLSVRHLQRTLVREAVARGETARGMSLARQLGMITYRGRRELDTRFGRLEGAQPPVADYLEHHGAKFADRFSPRTFLLLSEAIDRFSVPPEALSAVTARVDVVGVKDDQLFPYALQERLHRAAAAAGRTTTLRALPSEHGHDGFLADQDALAAILDELGLYEAAEVAPVRQIRLGLLGCGVVGQGLLALLARQSDDLRRRGVEFTVTQIAVRDLDRDRGPHAAGIPRTTDALAVALHPDVDVVVEVAGGGAVEPAIRAAMLSGRPVVTANKALIADKLADLAAQTLHAPLLCEASAAAALPILRVLSRRSDEVCGLMGIVNGTCNYLLTRMEQDEQPLRRALLTAQRRGLAEADPSADIDGLDAAAKLSILAYRSFGAWIHPRLLPTRGIRDLSPMDCDLAGAMGFRIRHIAHAAREDDGALHAAVEPLLLPDWHLLAGVEEEYNAVYLTLQSAGDLSFFGKGAGGLPTATAVLGDLLTLACGDVEAWPAPIEVPIAAPAARRHFLRVTAEHHRTLSGRIEKILRGAGVMVQDRASRLDGDFEHIAVITSPLPDAEIEALAARIRGLGRVSSVCWLGVVS